MTAGAPKITLLCLMAMACSAVPLSVAAQTSAIQEQRIESSDKPYRSEEVQFAYVGSDAVLSGTFSAPKGKGPFPAVVLLHGSGPNDRDEAAEGAPRRKFLVLADALNRAGIAVLRYDKRGVGKSTGNYANASFSDFLHDAQAAVSYLETRPDVAHIGVLGDSEGGYIAPLVAGANSNVRFVVLVSSPALPYDQINLLQKAALARVEGKGEAEIAARDALFKQVFQIVKAAPSADAARQTLTSLAGPAVANGQLSREDADAGIAGLTTPLGFELMRFDPQPSLKALKVPVLVIQGTLDQQVPATPNLIAMRSALSANTGADIREMPSINHQLQKAVTGAPAEYGNLPETVDEGVLTVITAWVGQQVRKR